MAVLPLRTLLVSQPYGAPFLPWEPTQRRFYLYGFGCRCMDAVRSLEGLCGQTGSGGPEGYVCREFAHEELPEVFPLVRAMYEGFRESPFFLNRKPPKEAEFLREWEEEALRYFGAIRDGRLCAILGIGRRGETFLSEKKHYRHIVAAYALPEYRGGGLYRELMEHTAFVLAAEGCTHLGVDFESINPAAYGFWRKDFEIYTHGLVRRIDERVSEIAQSVWPL